MTLAGRLGASMTAIVALATVSTGLFWYRGVERSLMPLTEDRLRLSVDAAAAMLAGWVDDAADDVRALRSTEAVDAIAEALAGAGEASPVVRERVARLFESELAAKTRYDQLRIISGAADGREIVRVDRSRSDGSVRVTAGGDLQSKSERPYYIAAMRLGQGELNVSPIELNREFGDVETPRVPVLRLASGLFAAGDSTHPVGVLVLNVDMRPALERFRRTSTPGAEMYLVDADGNYLVHPDTTYEFGADLGAPHRLADDHAELGAALSSDSSRVGFATTPAGAGKGVFGAAPVRLPGGRRLTAIAMLSRSDIEMPVRRGLRYGIAPTLVVGLLAMLVALVLARSVTKPLGVLTEAVAAFPAAPPRGLPRDEAGEVGVLARAFESMTEDVHATHEELEHEIDVRRGAEEELRAKTAHERLLIAVVESSSDAILAKTVEGTITAWNPAAERMYGYTADEAVGRSIDIVVPEDRHDELNGILEAVGRGERIEQLETIRSTRDGKRIEVSLTVSPVRDADGTVIGASTIARDITARRRADALFRSAVEASPSGMLVVDRGGRILIANETASRQFGYSVEEFATLGVDDLVPESVRTVHSEFRADYQGSPVARPMGHGRDLFALRKDGTVFPAEIGLKPLEWHGRALTLAVVIDVGPRRAVEMELERHALELQRSNADLEQFAYVASHDLQEPLRMVASYTELLAERYHGRLDADADKFINYAVDGAKRMQTLVRDLLQYSRISTRSEPFAPVDSGAVVREALKLLESAIRESGAVVDIEPDMPIVQADPGQLRQIFQNLIGNAIKFRGTVPPHIHVSGTRRDNEHEFRVEDNGIGIDPRFTEKVFQMFQRLHERGRYPGSGIGLAIVKKIVERHGGRIWFESEPGAGTRFKFTLAVAEDPIPA
jgi:PAS domain S-box-containing protein